MTNSHNRAVKLYNQGTLKRWQFAFEANRIVGQYTPGATLSLAEDINRSEDTVERYARAAKTFLLLWGIFRTNAEVRAQLRLLRRGLTPTHWAAMGQLWGNYEFDPDEAVSHLQTTLDEKASVKALRKTVNDMFGEPPPGNDVVIAQSAKRAANALSSAGLNADGEEATEINTLARRARAISETAARRAKAAEQHAGGPRSPTGAPQVNLIVDTETGEILGEERSPAQGSTYQQSVTDEIPPMWKRLTKFVLPTLEKIADNTDAPVGLRLGTLDLVALLREYLY